MRYIYIFISYQWFYIKQRTYVQKILQYHILEYQHMKIAYYTCQTTIEIDCT